MSTWFQLTVRIPVDQSDRVSDLMFEMGSTGVEIDDSDAEILALTGYFPQEVREEVLSEGLGEIEGARIVHSGEVPDDNWGTKWREHFVPVYPTDRMVIQPPWSNVAAPDGGLSLKIEPKTAFGTGSHSTTKMALQAIEQVIEPGNRVLDVGTGSGILSIAAVLLGASEALAVDTDPLAAENVAENIVLNNVSGIQVETRGVTCEDTGFHVSVANIISSVLTPLLPVLEASVVSGGHVILGGLLDREEEQFSRSVRNAGLHIVEITREAEWLGLMTKAGR